MFEQNKENIHEWPGGLLIFNHVTKVAILYDSDTKAPENRYDELEKHLKKKGYFLQVVFAPKDN